MTRLPPSLPNTVTAALLQRLEAQRFTGGRRLTQMSFWQKTTFLTSCKHVDFLVFFIDLDFIYLFKNQTDNN